MSSRLSLEQIEHAARSIDPLFLNTPQYECEPLGGALGCRLALKIETLNPIRSFKGRGADYLVSQLQPESPLVCASAGNFGQAMAYACRKRGIPLTVYASSHANPFKVERMRALGARVHQEGEDFDAAKLAAKRAALDLGQRFVEDGLDIETLAGAATMGLEWSAFPEPLDALLVPLGNGAMFNGVARAMKARSPRTRLIAVQAAGAPAMLESWRAGRVIVHDRIDTIADGIGVRVPISRGGRRPARLGGRRHPGWRGIDSAGNAVAAPSRRHRGRAFRRGGHRRGAGKWRSVSRSARGHDRVRRQPHRRTNASLAMRRAVHGSTPSSSKERCRSAASR